MKRAFWVLAAVFALGLSAIQTQADTLSSVGNGASCTGGTVEICFAPVADLGPVSIPVDALVDPGITTNPGPPAAYVGLVRLTIVDNVLEPAAVSANTADLCSPFSLLPFDCQVTLVIPIANPNAAADPSVTVVGNQIGEAWLGTLTVKVSGQPVAILPGYVDVLCAGGPSLALDSDCDGNSNLTLCGSGETMLTDTDCDGSPSVTELQAGSNPFYKYSMPEDKGRGFTEDWDGDGDSNAFELTHSPATNPFQRCSLGMNPNGWSFADPTHSCEDTNAVGGL